MSETIQNRHAGYGWIIGLIVAAAVWFGLGLIVATLLGMGWLDSIAFLACLGVVFILGATGWFAWADARKGSGKQAP